MLRKLDYYSVFLVLVLIILVVYSQYNSHRIVLTQHNSDNNRSSPIVQKVCNPQVPFIANVGQIANNQVKYYAPTFGSTVYITDSGDLVYFFASVPKQNDAVKKEQQRIENALGIPSKKKYQGWIVKEQLVNAKHPFLHGMGQTQTQVNYFIGNEPKKWKQNIATYQTVGFGEVYPGIKLDLRVSGKHVEKVFTVQPKAKVDKIKLKLEGATSLSINSTGVLEAGTKLGAVRFTPPVAYQENDGKKEYIQVAYHLEENNTYNFKVAKYDTSRQLIIDPMLASTFLGGSSTEAIYSLAIDSSGNVYLCGYTLSADFPVTPGVYQGSPNAGVNIFITKLDANLSSVLASTFLGGSGDDYAFSIAIGSIGNIYITGETGSTDFPTTTNAYDTSYNGGTRDGFVATLNKNLNILLSSTYLGGNADDYCYSLALDSSDNVYLTGYTSSTTAFPVTSGAFDTTFNGGSYDGFVSKLNRYLTALLSSTFLGGYSDDYAYSLALDRVGNVYVTGITVSVDFPIVPGSYDTTNDGWDGFVSKFDSDLTGLFASTFFGNYFDNGFNAIALDSAGYVYAAGFQQGWNVYPHYVYFPFWVADAIKFSPNLDSCIAAYYLGSGGDNTVTEALAIALDSSGKVYIAGFTDGLYSTPGAYDTTFNGYIDGFIARLNSDVMKQLAVTYLGGSAFDQIQFLALDKSGNVYVTGYTLSTDFPITSNAYDTTYNSGSDVFATKFTRDLAAYANPPHAGFYGSPTSGVGTLAVNFVDTSANYPTSWQWDFGDGETSQLQNPTHTYYAGLNNHTYTVQLIISNDYGTSTMTKPDYIFVSHTVPPIVGFYASPTSGHAPLTVNFVDTSANLPTSWYWDFGDGGTSTTKNATHTYIPTKETTSYTVKLIAQNEAGSNAIMKPQYITVYGFLGTNNGFAICTAIHDQYNLQMVSDGKDGTIIIWQDERNENGDIYGQRINHAGQMLWTLDGIGICTVAGTKKYYPQIISDGSGGAIITWYDYRNTTAYPGLGADIYAQRINGFGQSLWALNGVAVCTAIANQSSAQPVSDEKGGAIIAWQDDRSGVENVDIYAQRISNAGEILWADSGVAICVAQNKQWGPRLISDRSQGAIIVWDDERNTTTNPAEGADLYAQRVNGNGETLWITNGVPISTALQGQYSPNLVSDGSGGAIITWENYIDEGYGVVESDIYAQRLTSTGHILWPRNGVVVNDNLDNQNSPKIISDGLGGALITWEDHSEYMFSDIYAQRINNVGTTLWQLEGIPICTVHGYQLAPQLISDGNGGGIIIWTDNRNSSWDYARDNLDIYAQHANDEGTTLWVQNGIPICDTYYNQANPQIMSLDSGEFLIIWQDYRSRTDWDIYGQRIDLNGNILTPIELTPIQDIKLLTGETKNNVLHLNDYLIGTTDTSWTWSSQSTLAYLSIDSESWVDYLEPLVPIAGLDTVTFTAASVVNETSILKYSSYLWKHLPDALVNNGKEVLFCDLNLPSYLSKDSSIDYPTSYPYQIKYENSDDSGKLSITFNGNTIQINPSSALSAPAEIIITATPAPDNLNSDFGFRISDLQLNDWDKEIIHVSEILDTYGEFSSASDLNHYWYVLPVFGASSLPTHSWESWVNNRDGILRLSFSTATEGVKLVYNQELDMKPYTWYTLRSVFASGASAENQHQVSGTLFSVDTIHGITESAAFSRQPGQIQDTTWWMQQAYIYNDSSTMRKLRPMLVLKNNGTSGDMYIDYLRVYECKPMTERAIGQLSTIPIANSSFSYGTSGWFYGYPVMGVDQSVPLPEYSVISSWSQQNDVLQLTFSQVAQGIKLTSDPVVDIAPMKCLKLSWKVYGGTINSNRLIAGRIFCVDTAGGGNLSDALGPSGVNSGMPDGKWVTYTAVGTPVLKTETQARVQLVVKNGNTASDTVYLDDIILEQENDSPYYWDHSLF